MKKLFFLIAVCFIPFLGFSQDPDKTLIIDGVDINKIDIEYIEIAAYTSQFYGKKWAITIDIGKEYFNVKGKKYKDENGKEVDFKSPMDALNYLIECGWEYVNNTAYSSGGNSTSLNYLLKKQTKTPE